MIAIQSTRQIVCPDCGNNSDFLEVADNAVLTTRFIQNEDGTFSQEMDDSQILGEIHFYCGECGADLTQFHKRFLEMLF
ncbi:MAG: hypothetical protein L3J03_06485 [Desulfobacterales bacterium]|nr:hypothetical protein [Desulfobacterales bacterium]